MDRIEFSELLINAILDAWNLFIHEKAGDSPYAFALIGDTNASYLGYAIPTEAGLRRVAEKYDEKGYRYKGWDWENFDNIEKIMTWLRWANPDDGWEYGDFSDHFQIQQNLGKFVATGQLGVEGELFEEFCTELLTKFAGDSRWGPWSDKIVVGFTFGETPLDFQLSATRANRYSVVRKLWSQTWQANELSQRIAKS